MTTLTIDEPLNLEKTHFKSVSELYKFLAQTFEKKSEDEISCFDDLDFRELSNDEMNKNLKEKIALSKKKDISEFSRI